MGEWNKAPLESFLNRITYGFTNPMPTTASGPYMVTARDINHGRILYDQARKTSDKAFHDAITDKSRPNIGDVLVTKDGTLGRIAVVDKSNICINQSVALLKPNSCIRSRFLKYLLEEPNNFARMLGDADGTTIKHIYITRLAKMSVKVPPLAIQDSILEVLSNIDDKIELNRRMNATLEGLARALFRDWFVDFGPTRAKMAGDAPYLAPEIWSLFPDRLDEDGNPQGWEEKSVRDILELSYGKSLPAKKRSAGEIPVYGSGGITGTHNEPLVKGPTIIVGRKGTVGSLYWQPTPCFPIDTVFYVKPKASLVFCYYHLQTLGLNTMNTDAAVPGLNRDNAYRLPAIRADKAIREAFDTAVSPLRERMDANEQESRSLAQTRDLLLPKLMSGEVRVRKAADIMAKDNVVPFNQNKDLFGEPVLTDQQELERDAVIVAGVVRGFGRDGTHVVGNVRYQKGYLFVKRRLGDSVRDFQKMAAGPYSPDLAHDGGFVEACNRRFIKRASRNGHEGNVPADNMAQIGPLMDQYGIKDAIDWVIVRFRDKSRDELGLLATVDHIMCERKRMGLSVNASEIRMTLGADPEWQHKLSQPAFSEGKVRQAISELERLFGEAS